MLVTIFAAMFHMFGTAGNSQSSAPANIEDPHESRVAMEGYLCCTGVPGSSVSCIIYQKPEGPGVPDCPNNTWKKNCPDGTVPTAHPPGSASCDAPS